MFFNENCNTVRRLLDGIGIATIFFSQCIRGATNSECHRPVKLFCTQIVLFTINLSQNEIKYHSRFVCSSSDTGSEV